MGVYSGRVGMKVPSRFFISLLKPFFFAIVMHMKPRAPQAKTFHFKGYKYDPQNLRVAFKYQIEFSNREPLDFTETILLPAKPTNKLSPKALAKFLEPLHIILGISYYKIYVPSKVTLPFALSKEQAEFWTTVYKKGLGEFTYRNNLDPEKLARFPHSKISTGAMEVPVSNSAILGIGGGKDSIVAAEVLKEMKDLSVSSFLLETQKGDPVAEQVIKLIGNPYLSIKRVIDPKIFERYEGSYNGHIPISAIFAFVGLFSAALYGHKYVIVGNEASSNFGNITYKGETINHQWSKSAEFESMLQNYTRSFVTSDITYFSLLRNYYEIRIARMFTEHKKYFKHFSSCNRNFKVFYERTTTLWCGECPKCAFVFLILAPFIQKNELVTMFGKNMLDDDALVPLYGDILGFGKLKPFDCVGTFEEAQAALHLVRESYKKSISVKTFIKKIRNGETLTEKVLRTVPAPTIPTPFRFIGIKNVAIIGYGNEGKITEQYLKKNYPHLKIGILDESTDKNYLDKQRDYDVAIKTPGIPKGKITIPYTTATNIFFSAIKNPTIGITGTKGKSTTTSLAYEMIKASGKKVRLLGNIGNPMLAVLLEKNIDPKEIFVIELSSYMLDDIEYSPNVALLLNLFPEHMNYHGSVENYYAAKRNIFKFQKGSDKAFVAPFTAKIPLTDKDIPLLGEHNKTDIRAAITAAKVFGIKDLAIKKAIKNFKPLPHRLELVGTYNGITFYDDAISTTPESTIMALKSLQKVDTIFLGGTDRGYNFVELEKTLRKFKIKNIVLFPDSGKRVLKSRKGFTILETKSMHEAVAFAYKNSRPGTICLLSTASPSYSLWKNFEAKGYEFQKFVRTFPISKTK